MIREHFRIHRLVRLIVLCAFGLMLSIQVSSPALAQDPDPSEEVFAALVSSGYDVLDVGYYPDALGNPDRDTVFARMETITTDLDEKYIVDQSLAAFRALAKYFPNARNYVAVLRFDRWFYFFITNPQDWDDYLAKRIDRAALWALVGPQVRIYDTIERRFIAAKDFVSQNHTDKDQANKDFTGQGDSPLPPTNSNPNVQAENILLEPSTTYLPADNSTEGYLLATLTDREFSGLPGRGVNFTYEVRGQDERALGTTQTDQFGMARARLVSSRVLDRVLLRASTATLSAASEMLVGPPPGSDPQAQARAVTTGLNNQGYRDVDSEYFEYKGPTGETIRLAVAYTRVISQSFDREVYSQLGRMLGTLRTVMPSATILRPVLFYLAADGHDYALLFNLRRDIWDAYLRGDISENQLWSSLNYDGAVNENGVRTNEKDFISKNFSGAKQTRYSSAERRLVSTLTTEAWGEQLTVGSFLVPFGGFADSFRVVEMSGAASGFSMYATPDYNVPLFVHTAGQEAALQNLRLESGQYIIAVNAAAPPAQLILQFVEHLGR
jgi:hypothetical protein